MMLIISINLAGCATGHWQAGIGAGSTGWDLETKTPTDYELGGIIKISHIYMVDESVGIDCGLVHFSNPSRGWPVNDKREYHADFGGCMVFIRFGKY